MAISQSVSRGLLVRFDFISQSIDTCGPHSRLLGMVDPQLSGDVNVVARYMVSLIHLSIERMCQLTYHSSWMGSLARWEFERSMPIPASLPVSSAPLLQCTNQVNGESR